MGSYLGKQDVAGFTKWLHGQAVKTPPFHGGNPSSILGGVTKYARLAELADALDLGSSGRPWGFKSLIAHHKKTSFDLSFFMCAVRKGDLNPKRKIKFIAGRRDENNFSGICLPSHGERCYTV